MNNEKPAHQAGNGKMDRGWLLSANRLESPNADERCAGEPPTLVVLHNISLPPGEFAGDAVQRFFCNRLDFSEHPWFNNICTLKVSSHFYIDRSGELFQFVSCDRRAWHAGESKWRGRERCNDFSIGIELQGTDETAFETVQYHRLNQLLTDLYQTYPTLVDIAGHSDIAPGRKTDPGPFFDWTRVMRP